MFGCQEGGDSVGQGPLLDVLVGLVVCFGALGAALSGDGAVLRKQGEGGLDQEVGVVSHVYGDPEDLGYAGLPVGGLGVGDEPVAVGSVVQGLDVFAWMGMGTGLVRDGQMKFVDDVSHGWEVLDSGSSWVAFLASPCW